MVSYSEQVNKIVKEIIRQRWRWWTIDDVYMDEASCLGRL